MIPGINSVSPYVKAQMKGQVPLGEHYLKMKSYINKSKVSYLLINMIQPLDINTSVTAHNNTRKLEEVNKYSSSSTPKAISKFDEKPLASHRKLNLISQERGRVNVLANQGQNSIMNIGHPLNYNHNLGILGNKSMAKYLYRKQNQVGGVPTLKQSYDL